MLFFIERSWGGRGVQGGGGGGGGARVSRRVDPSPGCPIKGSASAEASGAAHYERSGLGCTWMSGADLLSCVKSDRQRRRRSGSDG